MSRAASWWLPTIFDCQSLSNEAVGNFFSFFLICSIRSWCTNSQKVLSKIDNWQQKVNQIQTTIFDKILSKMPKYFLLGTVGSGHCIARNKAKSSQPNFFRTVCRGRQIFGTLKLRRTNTFIWSFVMLRKVQRKGQTDILIFVAYTAFLSGFFYSAKIFMVL